MPVGENLTYIELTLADYCDMDQSEYCELQMTSDVEAGWASAAPGRVGRDLAIAMPGGRLQTNIRGVPIIIDLDDDQEGF